MKFNLAVLSGFQEEIVWTGVALLVLGAHARRRTLAAVAVAGGALLWSCGTLLVAYGLLRLWRTAGSIAAIALMTFGGALGHSVSNLMGAPLTDLADEELIPAGHTAAAIAIAIPVALVDALGLGCGLFVIGLSARRGLRARRVHAR